MKVSIPYSLLIIIVVVAAAVGVSFFREYQFYPHGQH